MNNKNYAKISTTGRFFRGVHFADAMKLQCGYIFPPDFPMRIADAMKLRHYIYDILRLVIFSNHLGLQPLPLYDELHR